MIDRQRKHFSENGKLARLHPLFEATESFLFIPAIRSQKQPFIRDSLDLKRFMSIVILALMPPFLFGIYNVGLQSLAASGGEPAGFIPAVTLGLWIVMPIVMVSYAVGLFWEILFASIRRHPISEGFLVTGLLFPLTLPPTIPLWQVAVGISFGVVIGKEIFGGTGRNIFNPALTARAFIFFAYPAQMSGDAVWVAVRDTSGTVIDAVTGATPLAITALAPTFDTIESMLHASGYTLSVMFTGLYPGSVGSTSALCCLLGAVMLVAMGVASYRIMLGGIMGVLLTGLLMNLLAGPDSMPWLAVNPIYHLVAGGFAFGITYMATDPVTAPGLDGSRWIYGFLIGALTVMIRVLNPAFPEGVMLSILFMNIFASLLDYIGIRMRFAKRVPNV
ncbi:MAG: NADH:ubiquinone reductase (Na(+)-transporting) subunit B [Desulfobacteraceae bacterium]|nr:MAG: NADH:ubiquinone reductase (Na(+)-transporting) subunit B [Desulfobacteraceae bacterium]